jgi:hypothetical protein
LREKRRKDSRRRNKKRMKLIDLRKQLIKRQSKQRLIRIKRKKRTKIKRRSLKKKRPTQKL